MHEELLKMLRVCGDSNNSCGNCPILEDGSCPHGEWEFAAEKYMLQAADAIEDLEFACNRYEKDYKALCKYLPKWIPVAEHLPEHEYGESTSVLTVDLFGVMRVAYFDGGNWCWPSGEALTTMRVAPITHWMPLPKPPSWNG